MEQVSALLNPLSPHAATPSQGLASFYKALLDNLFDGVYFVDAQRRIIYWNQGAEFITGYSSSDVLGKHCFDNLLGHVDDAGRLLCLLDCPLLQTIQDSKRREVEVYLRHKQGHLVPVSVRVAQIADEVGHVLGAVEVFSNISAKKRTERRAKELEGLAFQDTLTGIPNRRYAEMKVEQAIEEVERFGRPTGLLIADLDHFKLLNDTFGHAAGDAALVAITQAITDNLRADNMVARWGGEEFLLLIHDVHEDGLHRFSERLLAVIGNSPVGGAESSRLTASIGVTLIRPGDTRLSVIQRADELMYASKAAGRNRASFG